MIDFLFVNHSRLDIEFMKAQAEIFQMCNPGGGYRIVVADGTGHDGHRAQLEDLGFTVISYRKTPHSRYWGWDGSGQHGEGLDIAFEHVQTDVFCAQDPDHFWVEKDFCAIAEELMKEYVAIAMGHNFDCGKTAEMIRENLRQAVIGEAEGELRRPSGLVSLMGGTFLRADMLRKNRLTFEFSRPLYELTSYDEGFLVVNYLEKHRPDEVLWLRPQRVSWDNRPISFTTVAYLNGRQFGVHMKAGGMEAPGVAFSDKTRALKPYFIQNVLAMARSACA